MEQFYFPFFGVDLSIDQGFVLSPILFALYFLSIFHILKRKPKNLKIPVLFLHFVDNSITTLSLAQVAT